MSELIRFLWTRWWSDNFHRSSHGEKVVSAVGGFLGIIAILLVSARVLDYHGATMVIASMGASAVLLFAVPHGALSQPWSVVGGHLISAAIGVTCAQHIAAPYTAAALAVGLAIGAMYYLRCLHPPGGATALVAVLGGPSVHALGYQFMLTPVLLNVVVILSVAVLVNMPFAWRRYPQWLVQPRDGAADPVADEEPVIRHSDLVYALSQVDSFIDVSERDLIRIYNLAVHHTDDPEHGYANDPEADSVKRIRHPLGEAQPG